MLDKQNIIVESLESPPGNKGIEYQIAHEAYLKMVDYLRLFRSTKMGAPENPSATRCRSRRWG